MSKKLTKKQKGFADDYLDTGNGTLSALKNYDIESDKPAKVASVIAVENLAKPSVQAYLESKADKAASMVFTLSQEAEGEVVRLNASKDILDRAGYKPVERSESKTLSVTIDRKLENVELEALRLEFEEKLKTKLQA